MDNSKNVTRSENPINRAMDAIGSLANKTMGQVQKAPQAASALAQAVMKPLANEPKESQSELSPSQPAAVNSAQPKPFVFDWPNTRAHVMDQAKAELAAIEQAPFTESDYPKLMTGLLLKIAVELSIFNSRSNPNTKASKSRIIKP